MLTKNKYWLNFLHRIAVWLHLFLPNMVRKSCLLFKSKCSEWLSTDKQIARNKIHPSLCDMLVLWKAVQWFLWRAAVDIKHFSRPFFRHVATSLSGNLHMPLETKSLPDSMDVKCELFIRQVDIIWVEGTCDVVLALFLIQEEILSNVCMRCTEAIKEPSCLWLCACPTLLELIFHVALQWRTSTHKSTLWALPLRSQAGRFQGNVLNLLNETDIRNWRAFHLKTRLVWPGRKQKHLFYYNIYVHVNHC